MPAISREGTQAIAAILAKHPGVREVRVVATADPQQAEADFTAYVLPNQEYIDQTFPEDEQRRVKKWGKTFDLTQLAKETSATQAGFNIAGWNSSYTRQPIPAEEMQEWVDQTVEQILALEPKEVLEIGCGTGLLLLRIAERCSRYVGTDIAPVVLKKLREQMTQLPGSWEQVELFERPAENFAGLGEDKFDTFVLNSVVKYFPNVGYLNRVLESAVRVVRPCGRLFIGDVRNFALMEPYAFSIEMFQAAGEMSVEELRERLARRIFVEEQLVASPSYFVGLQRRVPKISRVEIRPKRGRYDNELTRFRFDAVLHLGPSTETEFRPSWVDWGSERDSLPSIEERLRKEQPEYLALRAIRNARVEKDVGGLAVLKDAKRSVTVSDLRKALSEAEIRGIDPYSLCAMADKSGYEVALSWKAARPNGSFDAVLQRNGMKQTWSSRDIAWPAPEAAHLSPSQQTNVPGKAGRQERFVGQLAEYVGQELTREIPASAITVVERMPTNV
jgi:SAM-dependent methyltransferase